MNYKEKMPSRERYEKNNPVVSFRVNKVWYIEFKDFLKQRSLSIGDFFRIAFKKQKVNYKKARRKEYKAGYLEGYENGFKKGDEKKNEESFDDGYKKGFDVGNEEGFEKGIKDGYEKGFEDGFKKGEKKGYDIAFRKYCIWYNCVVCDEAIIIEANSERHNLIKKISRKEMWGHYRCFQRY